MPYANRKLEWKIGEPGADEVCNKNVRMMDGFFGILPNRCANEFCRWPISSLRINSHSVPGLGDVCATCHDMYTAVIFMNLKLNDSNYFKRHHEAWKKEQEDIKRKRRNMGLDEGAA